MPDGRNGRRSSGSALARGSTLVVTNFAKLVGLALAVNEAAVRPNARESVLAFCALCLVGTQAAENTALRFIDRLFDGPSGRSGDEGGS